MKLSVFLALFATLCESPELPPETVTRFDSIGRPLVTVKACHGGASGECGPALQVDPSVRITRRENERLVFSATLPGCGSDTYEGLSTPEIILIAYDDGRECMVVRIEVR